MEALQSESATRKKHTCPESQTHPKNGCTHLQVIAHPQGPKFMTAHPQSAIIDVRIQSASRAHPERIQMHEIGMLKTHTSCIVSQNLFCIHFLDAFWMRPFLDVAVFVDASMAGCAIVDEQPSGRMNYKFGCISLLWNPMVKI